ncbi:MAG: Trp biosynthesis-associated membrane protein, partial [Streptosporangiaceae bacterium]|nr:Trp biosynthesis-associated membrane protein [Streptosporangiaceae bacterium]
RAAAAAGSLGGSTTGGAASGGAARAVVIAGSSGHAVLVGVPWRAAAACGAVAIVLAGLGAAWRGPRWPVMSARFERSGQQDHLAARADSAAIWEALSRDTDPTVDRLPGGARRGAWATGLPSVGSSAQCGRAG